jgi:hypothetical protein
MSLIQVGHQGLKTPQVERRKARPASKEAGRLSSQGQAVVPRRYGAPLPLWGAKQEAPKRGQIENQVSARGGKPPARMITHVWSGYDERTAKRRTSG